MTRTRRHLSACAAAGVIGAALAPGLAVAPAAAAPSACAAPRFGAAAAADLVRVDALDLHALGVNVGPAASVRVASTAAGTTGGPSGRSASDARYLQAKILGGTVPAGPLDAKAHQEAPPAAEAAINAATPGVNSGVLALGTGSLTAHSTWACTPSAGTVAESSVALVDAGVLPRNGRSLLHVPHNLASGASTGFVRQQGALRPQATASADLTDLTLFEGTAGQVRVRVVSQPKLTVVAGGSAAHSTVAYSAPVLQVTGPNGITHTLNSPTQHVDLAVPAGSNAAADDSAAVPAGGVHAQVVCAVRVPVPAASTPVFTPGVPAVTPASAAGGASWWAFASRGPAGTVPPRIFAWR